MNKQAYEHMVGMVLNKRANLWDDIVNHVKSNKDHYWRALGGGLIGGGLGYALSRKPVGILLGMLLGAGSAGGISKWLSTPAGNTPAGNTPAGNTPAGNTPAGNTPAGNTPAPTMTSAEYMANSHLEDALKTRLRPEVIAPTDYVISTSTDPNYLLHNAMIDWNVASKIHQDGIDILKKWQDMSEEERKRNSYMPTSAKNRWREASELISNRPYFSTFEGAAELLPIGQEWADRDLNFHLNAAKQYSQPPYAAYAALRHEKHNAN